MSVAKLDLKDAISHIEACDSATNPVTKNFQDIFGTSGCLLNCRREQTLEAELRNKNEQHAATISHSKKKLSENRKAESTKLGKSRHSWFTNSKLKESAEQGCGSCGIFKDIFLKLFFPDALELPDIYEYGVSQDFEFSFGQPRVDERSIRVVEVVASARLFQPPDLGLRFERIQPSQFLLGQEKSLERLRHWMQNCHANHKTCSQRNAGMNDTNRPGRLLDLTHLSHQNRAAIRLIETQPGISYQYTCLSHRWDDLVKATRTTTDNIAENMKLMYTDILPKNFTDAMHIARNLGIQYIWIDSICIIQPKYIGDDDADLIKEMAKMGSIYQNSLLTIGAISSPTSSGGCFMHAKWPDICMLLAPSCSLGTSTQTYFVGARILDGKGQCVTRDDIHSRYPLITRGWVFQERLLSTRFLHCNYGEFAFECLESAPCECESNIAPHPARKSANAIRHINFTTQRRLLGSNAGAERKHALEYWKTIVQNYMELSLSVDSDVLPAMGGCAKALASSLGLTYIAGLWEHSFDTDLLWHVRTDRRKREPGDRKGKTLRVKFDRPLDSTCPSWSWASIKMPQPITHIERDVGAWETSNRLLEGKIKNKHWVIKNAANPFGELDTNEPAYLELDATLFPWYLRTICVRAKFERQGNTRFLSWDLHVKRQKNKLFCTTDIEELDADDAAVEVFLDAHLRKEGMSEEQFHNCVNTMPPYCRLAQVYFLPAMHKQSLPRTLDVMLVLIRIPPVNGKSNCYKRIGLLKVMNERADIKTWNTMLLDRVKPIGETFWLF